MRRPRTPRPGGRPRGAWRRVLVFDLAHHVLDSLPVTRPSVPPNCRSPGPVDTAGLHPQQSRRRAWRPHIKGVAAHLLHAASRARRPSPPGLGARHHLYVFTCPADGFVEVSRRSHRLCSASTKRRCAGDGGVELHGDDIGRGVMTSRPQGLEGWAWSTMLSPPSTGPGAGQVPLPRRPLRKARMPRPFRAAGAGLRNSHPSPVSAP